MISYNSQTTKGEYKIQIETDNKKYFRIIEEMVRLMIDKSSHERLLKSRGKEHGEIRGRETTTKRAVESLHDTKHHSTAPNERRQK